MGFPVQEHKGFLNLGSLERVIPAHHWVVARPRPLPQTSTTAPSGTARPLGARVGPQTSRGARRVIREALRAPTLPPARQPRK